MAFSPQTFLSNIKAKDGLARPNRYEVIVPIPEYIGNFVESSVLESIMNFPNSIFDTVVDGITSTINQTSDQNSVTSKPSLTRYLALQCENAELPGKTLQTADVKIYGPTFKVPYQTQYADTNLTFLCTNEYYERKLFERWMEAIMPTDSNNLRYAKGDKTRYLTNIKIIQYDDFIKKIFAVELIDAFPIGIAPQPLNWADDSFHRLGVQFAYQKYRVVYDGGYDLVSAAIELFGTRAAARIFDKTGVSISNEVNRVLGGLF